ncbi:MAG: ABC transporter permease [Candidatus Micrarchaeota archaeon]
MNLLNELEKDSKQFFRERRTLLLLVIAPLLVLFLLGLIFGNTTTEISKTTLGVCDFDHSNVSKLFVSGMAANAKIIDYSGLLYCSPIVDKEVREGRLPAAIIIPHGFQAGIERGNTQNVTVLVDNSRVQVAPSVEAFVKAAVQETGQQVGIVFIGTVWDKLDQAAARLDNLTNNLNETRQRTAVMKARLEQTTASLQAINSSRINNEIDAANGTIDSALGYLASADSNLTQIEADLVDYDSELNQTEADLVQINSTLRNVTDYINISRSGVNCSQPVFVAYCAQLDTINKTVADMQQSIEQRIGKVQNARVKLAQTNITIQEFRGTIADATASSAEAGQRIANMRQFAADLESNKQAALDTIAEVNRSLDEITDKSYELESIITDSRNQLKEITSRTPQSVVSPIILSTNYLFKQRTFFDFLLPSLLPTIVMFISLFLASTSLVREKSNGTMARIVISQINPYAYAAIKVVSYSLVLLPMALLLALMSSLLYGAFPLFDLATWFFVLQALALLLFVFVAGGVLIAIYSESEATAFLASLVIGLPLLFMSGLLFPAEFMPQLMAAASQASPLTQSVFIMQSVILYHAPQAGGFGVLLLYGLVLTLLCGLSLRRAAS